MGDGTPSGGGPEISVKMPPRMDKQITETASGIQYIKPSDNDIGALIKDYWQQKIDSSRQIQPPAEESPIKAYAANPDEVPTSLKAQITKKLELSPELIEKFKNIDWDQVLSQEDKTNLSQPHSSSDQKPPESKKPLSGLQDDNK